MEALIIVAERFKNGLMSRATGGGMADLEFKQDRQILMISPVKHLLPRFVLTCRTPSEFWSFIKSKIDSYEGRRQFLQSEFEGLLWELENPLSQNAKMVGELKAKIDSHYLSQQIDIMIAMQKENPTEAIGKAKELVETICKAILDEKNIEYKKADDLSELMGKVVTVLELTPDHISDEKPLSKTIKQVLGNLRAISSGLAELRNPYGGGHGKSLDYKGLEERHAKLAVGSATILASFLWDSHVDRKNKGGGGT
ncbi:MAG: abortive infection family protein [Firmicutes bacterium]|nr:abortive infection family protein [Bacillota bacterium]